MNLTLVGLGTLSTSLGLALKSVTKEIPITGHDPEGALVARAKKLRAIDKSHWNLIAACEQADLILLDVPLNQIEMTLKALAGNTPEQALIMVMASVQRPVMAWAQGVFAGHHLVGGHVVSPKLLLGEAEPAAELLQGAIFYVLAPEGTAAEVLDTASNLAEAVGARPHYIDASEHDGLMAATAHLPTLEAAVTLALASETAGWEDRTRALGGEFAALSGALVNAPAGAAEMLLANSDNVLHWLDAYLRDLARVRQMLVDKNQPEIEALVERALKAHAQYLSATITPESEIAPVERVSPWRDMFLGRLGRPKSR